LACIVLMIDITQKNEAESSIASSSDRGECIHDSAANEPKIPLPPFPKGH
jgi:hypothetical protein